MLKLSALNEESEEESRSEEEVTREALEQIALQQYAKALELQRKGNLADATQLLKDLLETELLDDIKKPAAGEKISSPLFNLKYLCYKNLASMLSSAGEIEAGVEAYIAASELDDTDITLWHRLGQLCLRGQRYEMALHAFQKGTERNPKHWPCLDKIVTLLLGLDFKEECISTIYDTLQLDPGYLRGLVYRRHIYTTYPYIRRFMEYLNPIYKWNDSEDEQINEEQAEKLLKEAENIHEIFLEQQKAEKVKCIIPNLKLMKPITQLTWESVGDSLVNMHHYITENCYSHACHIEIIYEKESTEEPMEICEENKEIKLDGSKAEEHCIESENNAENEMDNGNSDVSDKEKPGTDTEKVESDTEMVAVDATENPQESITGTPLETSVEKSPDDQVFEKPEKGTELPSDSDVAENTLVPMNENLSVPVTEDPAALVSENPSEPVTANLPESATENPPEIKKKQTVRKRESALSNLQMWNWYTRRSGRKKHSNAKDRLDNNIYDTLRRMVPMCLAPEVVHKKEDREKASKETSFEFDPALFDEKNQEQKTETCQYFGTEGEQNDVREFIKKYTENKRDIIEMLKDFLIILAEKWKVKWPVPLPKIYIEANKCYNNHIDIPACVDENREQLLHYTMVNLLVEELSINETLNNATEEVSTHDRSVIETVGMILALKPHFFPSIDILEFTLRHLWVKLHIHVLEKHEEFGLDCLYQLSYEFEAMGEYHDAYSLEVINFTFKPVINEQEICQYIKFLERNKKLSTVMDLYKRGNYEDVLTIVLDSFEHGRDLAKKQEEEMSLDFAVQLSVILDTYWALDKVDECFKWSLICLHEALKHYFRYTSGSSDYDKWTLTVVKILCCMEHILTTEGLSCLEAVSQKELSQGLDDLIRIIGHQVETKAAEMPFGTVSTWIIMHYILQREEDQGRGRYDNDGDKPTGDEVPNPLMVLFIGHEQLGNRGWCCQSDGKLLCFILDTVVPRLRSPSLAKSLEQVCQYMEQCVYCLYGHPSRKNKLKYLVDHNVTPRNLDWKRAQQVYEIFRPPTLPALEGKVSGITADTEQLFHRILELLPPEQSPQKYVPDVEKYILGVEDSLPSIPPLLPYKMRDIYFLLGDFHFKKEETKMAIKYNIYDVIINNNRLESWAQISLAKACNLTYLLNSCKNLNNEREFLNPAKSTIRCFKRSLELDPTHCNMWIEYGIFVYTVHSFCSRALKSASESLSMENFEFLEKQKEDMLDMTHTCFMTVLNEMENTCESDKCNEDGWLHFYMLGKVAEKRNMPPSVYLDYYLKGVKSLQETDATYPLKINYNQPSHLSIEVLELHYRIHASILKYIEQHENKPIPTSVGKTFLTCLQEWSKGPFSRKPKKDVSSENETENKIAEPIHAANILKRSISNAGDEDTHEAKRMKLEAAAAKVRRSASYDNERLGNKEAQPASIDKPTTEGTSIVKENIEEQQCQQNVLPVPNVDDINGDKIQKVEKHNDEKEKVSNKESEKEKKGETSSSSSSSSSSESSSSDSSTDSSSDSSRDSDTSPDNKPLPDNEIMKIVSFCLDALEDCASRFPPHYKAIYRLAHYHFYYKKGKDIERCRDLMLLNFTSRAGQKLSGLFNERKPSNFFNNIWKNPLAEVDRAGGFAFHMSRSVLLTMEILKEIDDHKTLLDLSLHLQRIPDPDRKYLRDSDREELAQQAFSLCVQSLKGQLLKFSQQADLKSNDVERQALKSLMIDIYKAYTRVQKQPSSKQFTALMVEAYKLVTTGPITESMNLVDLSLKYCQSLNQALKQQAIQANIDKNQNAQKKQTMKPSSETTKVATSTNTAPKTDSKTPSATAKPTASTSASPKMSFHEMAAAFQSFLPILPTEPRQTAAALSYLTNMSALAGYSSSLQNTLQASLHPSLASLTSQNSFQAEFYRQFLGQTLSAYNLPPPPKKKRGPKPGSSRSIPTSASSNTSQLKTSKSFPNTSVSSSKPYPTVSTSSASKAAPTPVITNLQKATSSSLAPSMGTVLPSLPASLTANIISSLSGGLSSHSSLYPTPAHASSSSHISTSLHSKYSMPQASASSTSIYSKSTISQQSSNVNSPVYSKSSMGASQPQNIYSKSSKSQQTSHIPSMQSKSTMPQQQLSPGKTLQEKLAERQKNIPSMSKAARDITSSINKLPSSLTITKTSVPKPPPLQKKPEPKPAQKSKQISSDEVIVLDDD